MQSDATGLHGENQAVPPSSSGAGRRATLLQIAKLTSTVLIPALFTPPALSAAPSGVGTPDRPVLILGGSGRTGMLVAETLAGPLVKMNTVISTRSGSDPFKIVRLPSDVASRLTPYPNPVDVRDKDALAKAMRDVRPGAVVFAASASKKGGSASEVDDSGVENAAMACRDLGARLVLVSSLAVDRPESKSFKVTNTMGGYLDGIMDAKRRGEEKARAILGDDYVIIRPGVLMSGKSKGGPVEIELNQGDTMGGGISRDELAGVVAGALVSGKKGVTVEAYRKETRTGLQPEFGKSSGNEVSANTYEGLFELVKVD